MPGSTFTTLEAIERQADGCIRAGSELYGTLLHGLAADYQRGGLTAELLDGVSDRPLHDAVPLRFLAAGHRSALAGTAPELAAVYPSCGGQWTGEDLTEVFLSVVATQREEFQRGLHRAIQTNEVGRAVVLTAGFSHIASRHHAALRTLEIGASAGLLSRWPSYHYDTGESSAGDPASPVRFGPDWFADGRLPPLRSDLAAIERRACDISPIDATTEDGRLTMLSFLWPDQLERFERLSAALTVAAADPITVDAADAGTWLAERLAPVAEVAAEGAAAATPVATVVFHSIVWQYLPAATKNAIRDELAAAGARATTDEPLCWLRMEPANTEHADLRLTTWNGTAADGVDEVLAHVGYHGANVAWLSSTN